MNGHDERSTMIEPMKRNSVLACILALSSFLRLCFIGPRRRALREEGRQRPHRHPQLRCRRHAPQGEQRYRANCGRCHAAPRKFPPRMMATVLRHMRVRATITDEDMRLVLFYMSQ